MGEGMREGGDQKVENKCDLFQLPPKRINVFCLVKLVWHPVSEDGCGIVECPCSLTFFFACVLAKSKDAESAQGRGEERTGWIVLGN